MIPHQSASARNLTMADMLKSPIIVIDPEEPYRINTIPEATQQQLQALEDCDYIIVHPLLNLVYKNGSWEPIPLGQISQTESVVVVRNL